MQKPFSLDSPCLPLLQFSLLSLWGKIRTISSSSLLSQAASNLLLNLPTEIFFYHYNYYMFFKHFRSCIFSWTNLNWSCVTVSCLLQTFSSLSFNYLKMSNLFILQLQLYNWSPYEVLLHLICMPKKVLAYKFLNERKPILLNPAQLLIMC